MKLRNRFTNAMIGATAVAIVTLVATPASASTITFQPQVQSVAAGSAVDVALVISDLVAGAGPSLSTFDLEISFNEAVLSFAGAAFGDPVLGDQLDLAGFGTITSAASVAGVVSLFELSFDLPGDLETLQAGSFVLATLTFNATAAGVSPLGITVVALGDAVGDPLAADVVDGSIEVTGASVPEPGLLVLLLGGLAGVASSARRSWAR